MAAWFLWGHHCEIYSGVYIYYARMWPLRSRYRLDFASLITVPASSFAPCKVSSFISWASDPPFLF